MNRKIYIFLYCAYIYILKKEKKKIKENRH